MPGIEVRTELFKQLCESSSDALAIATYDGTIQWSNRAFNEEVEPPDSDLNLRTLVHPEDREALRRSLKDLVEHDKPQEISIRFRSRGGFRLLSLRSAPSHDRSAMLCEVTPSVARANMQDTSNVKIGPPDELLMRSETTIFETENFTVLRSFGDPTPLTTPSELLENLLSRESANALRRSLESIAIGETGTFTTTVAIENVKRHIGLTFRKISSSHAWWLLEDHTYDEQMHQRLASLETSLDQFTKMASHNLRAPLRAITHLAQWIVEDARGSLNPQCQEHLRKLIDRTERMDNLLNALLRFSRSTQPEAGFDSFDIEKSIHQLGQGVELEGRDLQIAVNTDVELPIQTAVNPLRAVLTELIENAVYHHDDDVVCVNVSVKATPWSYLFSIQDDGPGIAHKHHQRIFEPLQTLRSKQTDARLGIGLPLVRRILHSCGSDIEIDSSQSGRGSVFRFHWPKRWSSLQVTVEHA
ncbi:MAG: PAS domain-containing sensor histidine kinase [Myxococcota bacterium]